MLEPPKTRRSKPDLAADQLDGSWLSRQRELLTASLDNIASAAKTALHMIRRWCASKRASCSSVKAHYGLIISRMDALHC